MSIRAILVIQSLPRAGLAPDHSALLQFEALRNGFASRGTPLRPERIEILTQKRQSVVLYAPIATFLTLLDGDNRFERQTLHRRRHSRQAIGAAGYSVASLRLRPTNPWLLRKAGVYFLFIETRCPAPGFGRRAHGAKSAKQKWGQAIENKQFREIVDSAPPMISITYGPRCETAGFAARNIRFAFAGLRLRRDTERSVPFAASLLMRLVTRGQLPPAGNVRKAGRVAQKRT